MMNTNEAALIPAPSHYDFHDLVVGLEGAASMLDDPGQASALSHYIEGLRLISNHYTAYRTQGPASAQSADESPSEDQTVAASDLELLVPLVRASTLPEGILQGSSLTIAISPDGQSIRIIKDKIGFVQQEGARITIVADDRS